jgi:hypothetical protein
MERLRVFQRVFRPQRMIWNFMRLALFSSCVPYVFRWKLRDKGELQVKRNLLAACVLSFALANAGSAQAMTAPQEQVALCARAHLKQLVREAHTPEQYNALADCYEKLQKDYLEQAAEEKQEWERRSQNVTASAAKYPRPVDSARNLYEYDLSMASQAGKLSLKYSQLAARKSPAKTLQPLLASITP